MHTQVSPPIQRVDPILFCFKKDFQILMNTTFSQSLQHIKRDALAGTVTGAMAVPLSIGICLLSDYPVMTGLYTVIFACLVSFTTYLDWQLYGSTWHCCWPGSCPDTWRFDLWLRKYAFRYPDSRPVSGPGMEI